MLVKAEEAQTRAQRIGPKSACSLRHLCQDFWAFSKPQLRPSRPATSKELQGLLLDFTRINKLFEGIERMIHSRIAFDMEVRDLDNQLRGGNYFQDACGIASPHHQNHE